MTRAEQHPSAGVYLVATPIGNLEDITRRAVRLLESADVVAAEDTRRARALLSHLGIGGKRVVALDANASEKAVAALVDQAARGDVVCVTTDAGMPSISDPGLAAVKQARERGVPVSVAPGASAVTAAVALSGLVDLEFLFLGFLPRKGEKRRRVLARMVVGLEPAVFFESPQRVAGTLRELAELMPARPASVARELTKLHEEVLHGTLQELAALPGPWRGELTLVVAANPAGAAEGEPNWQDVDQRIVTALEAGATAKDLARELATVLGVSRRELYARILELRTSSGPKR